MNIEAFIAQQLAKPITHHVVTRYLDGRERVHGVRSAGQADNHAIGERWKIGRDLISRDTGMKVRVVQVEIVEL